jgi:hypothetical protein
MVEFFKFACKLYTLTLGDLAVMQALGCNEIWNLYNGVSLCYSCNKTLEKISQNEKYVYCYRWTTRRKKLIH